MKRYLFVPLIIALIMGACAAPASPAPTPTFASASPIPAPTEPMIRATVTAPPTLQTLVPVSNNSRIDAVLVSLTADQKGLIASPVNSETLEDSPNYKPIDLQHHYSDTVSPDGQLWAVITWPSDENYGGALHLIDLKTWTDTPVPLKFDNWAQQMTFSPDGSRLVVAEYWDKVGGGVDHWGADIKIINPAEPEEFKSIELSFSPRYTQFSLDGQRIVVYGTPWLMRGESTYMATGAPQVMAFDVATRKAMWSLTLEGVKDGAYSEPTADDPKLVNFYTPGIAFSADGLWLYVVHPDEERLTAVDLIEGSPLTMEIIEPQSLLDRLIGLTAGTAYAKGGAFGGADKKAVLSSDGKLLYITGVQREVQKDLDSPGGFKEVDNPLDIQVIDPQSGERLLKEEAALTGKGGRDVVLSPDGRSLYLTPHWPTIGIPGLEVFETVSLKPVAQFAEGATYIQLAFSSDNARAYFMYQTDNPAKPAIHLSVLDTASHQLIATREVPGWVGTLVLPPR